MVDKKETTMTRTKKYKNANEILNIINNADVVGIVLAKNYYCSLINARYNNRIIVHYNSMSIRVFCFSSYRLAKVAHKALIKKYPLAITVSNKIEWRNSISAKPMIHLSSLNEMLVNKSLKL